ncbi:MAG: SusD/RagB family nutrient-binding outer membrane lipoprotein [Parabacteroides merdae]
MVELSSEDDLDAHTGLYYFLKGWYFYRTTMDMGDIPYSEALNIEEHRYPQYDEQKDVFKGILEDLALADEYFAKSKQAFSGDPFYQGDPKMEKSDKCFTFKSPNVSIQTGRRYTRVANKRNVLQSCFGK